MNIRLFTLVLASFIISIHSHGKLKKADICDTIPTEFKDFDFKACKFELNKTLEEIDYKALYQETTHQRWGNTEITLRSSEECKHLTRHAYTSDEIEAHLDLSPPSEHEPGEPANTQVRKKLKKKKNPCFNLITSERAIHQEIISLSQSLDLNDSELTDQVDDLINTQNEEASPEWPSALALKISLFLKDHEKMEESISFLKLLLKSSLKPHDRGLLQLSMSLIENYNTEIQFQRSDELKAVEPSAKTYLLLQSALQFLNSINSLSADEILFIQQLSTQMRAIRNHMIRWPLSPEGLVTDTYFPQYEVARMIYSKDFIENLLLDLDELSEVLKAKKYQGRKNISTKPNEPNRSNDLADALYSAGFYGVEGTCNGSPQHTWVHPKGFIVRTKKSTRTHNWEFTLGLTFINPMHWKTDHAHLSSAIALIKLADLMKMHPEVKDTPYYKTFTNPAYGYFNTLSHFKYNEAFKIRVTPSGWVTLMPAFPGYRTGNHWGDHIVDLEQELKSVHYPLDKVGYGNNCDLSVIRSSYLSHLR